MGDYLHRRGEAQHFEGVWRDGSVFRPGQGWVVLWAEFEPAEGWRGRWKIRPRSVC